MYNKVVLQLTCICTLRLSSLLERSGIGDLLSIAVNTITVGTVALHRAV